MLSSTGMRYTLSAFSEEVRTKLSENIQGYHAYYSMAIWDLLNRGLIYFEIQSTQRLDCWTICLTEKGKALAENRSYNPDDPVGYMEKLNDDISDLSKEEILYFMEALYCYEAKRYLPSAVMAGVVAEKAVLDLVNSLLGSDKLIIEESPRKKLENDRIPYSNKKRILFEILRKNKKKIGPDLFEGIEGVLEGISEMIRIHRNDAGHPKAIVIESKRIHAILQSYPWWLERIHALKNYFEN